AGRRSCRTRTRRASGGGGSRRSGPWSRRRRRGTPPARRARPPRRGRGPRRPGGRRGARSSAGSAAPPAGRRRVGPPPPPAYPGVVPRPGSGPRLRPAVEARPEGGAVEVGVLRRHPVQPPGAVVGDVAVLAEPERDRRLDLRPLLPLVEGRDRDPVRPGRDR